MAPQAAAQSEDQFDAGGAAADHRDDGARPRAHMFDEAAAALDEALDGAHRQRMLRCAGQGAQVEHGAGVYGEQVIVERRPVAAEEALCGRVDADD